MAISYSRLQRERSKKDGLHLVSISVPGVSFQGPTSAEEAERLRDYLMEFIVRRRAWLESLTPTAPEAGR